jgi:hypothetical protein
MDQEILKVFFYDVRCAVVVAPMDQEILKVFFYDVRCAV